MRHPLAFTHPAIVSATERWGTAEMLFGPLPPPNGTYSSSVPWMTIDGKPAGYLKSSGIAYATTSKIELGVAGKDGYFDDIQVWDAEPAKR